MTLKQFTALKIAIAVVVSIVVGVSVASKNYLIPIMVVALAFAILLVARRAVKEIVADERDYEIGGKAALLAIKIFSWLAVITMFVFFAFSDTKPDLSTAALTISYSVCLLMLIYSAIFKYYSRK
ncbi:MAG: DUF2178 domain-containing protein [Candidatus Paceibacterota bacterium]